MQKVANYQQNFKAQTKAVEKKLDMPQPFDADEFMNSNPKAGAAWTENHKVVYTSRTHSQLAQAMKELKVTEYRYLRGVALGSRDQLCINDEVLKSSGSSSEKVHLCRAKVKAKLCHYHGKVEKALENPMVTNQTVLDIEDLVKVGTACGACPYYMSKQISGEADIVFLPYNYVLDPKLLKSFALKLENSIVILDEGHNVEKVCQDAASSQIASSDIATCVEDITHIMKLLDDNDSLRVIPAGEDSAMDFTIEDCAMMKGMVLALENEVDSITQVTTQGRAVPGGKIFEILNAANITQESFPSIMKLFDFFLEFLTQSSAGKVFARKGAGIMKLSEFLGTVYGSMTKDVESWKGSVQKGYRVYFEQEPDKKKTGGSTSDGWMSKSSVQTTINNKAKIINFWCFNPGFGMANLINRNVHSIILTSGTLAPLKPLISELALSANYQLENPHVIKQSQVMAKIIPSGPDGQPLNGSFQNRDNPKYLHSLGLTVRTVAVNTPNGLLVFFSSYASMNKTREAWEASGLWKGINDVKPIFIEPRKKEEFDECMNDYYTAVKTTRGAIFMAVLRGKVSEGLDFKDQNGRAVIVIGLPFPPYLDAKVVLKREYLEMTRTPQNQLQTGQEWYNIEATRAVNQAIGRVIRHKDDYGVILLCDQRFYNYMTGLSRWVQGHIKKPNGKFMFGPVIRELGEFFRNASSTMPAPVEVKVEPLREIECKPDLINAAKAKSEILRKNQIKIENSNEIYSSAESTRANFDYSKMQNFIKQEDKPKTFMGGLNKNVTTIDFNSVGTSNQSTKQASLTSGSSSSESAAKKRKITLVPNSKVEVSFVMNIKPVKVSKELCDKWVPENRSDFLVLVKQIFVQDSEHYKYLLNHLNAYNVDRDFTSFWNGLMPMFKYYVQYFHIFKALKRFLSNSHKLQFDVELEKHFIAE